MYNKRTLYDYKQLQKIQIIEGMQMCLTINKEVFKSTGLQRTDGKTWRQRPRFMKKQRPDVEIPKKRCQHQPPGHMNLYPGAETQQV